MQAFRRLSGNIFFKIFLGFIILSFVLFGVSGFLLSGAGSWVAKVGDKTITQSALQKEMQKNRKMILRSNQSEEAQKYVESDQFKSDSLGRMVNAFVISKLSDDLGIEASRNLILQEVAKDSSFKNAAGKFDHKLFKAFLDKNGLDEAKYVKMVQDEVVARMIIQTMQVESPSNMESVLENESFKKESRFADVAIISDKNLGRVASPKKKEIEEFFAKNKEKYSAPETRKVSYLKFSQKGFAKGLKVSTKDAKAEYEKNIDKFKMPESKDFYHIVFSKEDEAKDFLRKLESSKTKPALRFARLAKKIQKKSKKDITLEKVTQKDLIPELSKVVFKLALNEHSKALKSPLGHHVFLLTSVNESQTVAFSKVKKIIKSKMLESKKNELVQAKVSEIDDLILTSNSLKEVAKKFSLKTGKAPLKINQAGQDKSGKVPNSIKSLSGFAQNAFAAKLDQSSKLFFSKESSEYYAVKVEEIEVAHERELSEVKAKVKADLVTYIRQGKLRQMAQRLEEEIKTHPSSLARVAAREGLKLERNKEFPRIFHLNFQGRQIPYANDFLKELFDLKIGEATSAQSQSKTEFMIGVLKSVKKPSFNQVQVERFKKESEGSFRQEVLKGYNEFIMKKYPVKVNEKVLGVKNGAAAR